MGSVYRCHNRNAPRILAAVKVLELPTNRHPDTTARFVREAEILFSLDHPNIVKVRNIRTEHDPPYLEMEFVEGESLEDALEKGPITGEKGLDVIRQCAKALHYLHHQGVRHRDIKPANFLLRKDGRVKLVDFGLALEQDVSRITQAGMAFGTVSYAPPEWANPETLDPVKWDMYALGIVMYEVLTGDVAFPVSGQGSARQQAMQVILSKQGHEPLDPGEAHPAAVRALIGDLTRSDPDERLADAGEVLRRLGVELRRNDFETTSEEDHPSVVTTMPTPGIPAPRRSVPETWAAEPDGASNASGGRSVWILAFLVLLVLGGGAAAALALAGGFAWYASSPTTRGVEVVLTGITGEMPHQVSLDGRVPDSRTGLQHRFDDAPFGDHEIAWVVGAGCELDRCLEADCPPTCGHGVTSITLSGGDGRFVEVIDVASKPRAVRLPLPPLPDDVEAAVTVAGQPTTAVANGVKTAPLRPGKHAVVVSLGTCPDGQGVCDDDCPDACLVASTEVLVPWSGAPEAPTWTVDLVARWAQHTTPEPPEPTPKPTPVPTPKPVKTAGAAGSLVTQGELAGWLEGAGQTYQPGGLRDYGNGHLAGWTGATPPAPAKAVVGIAFPAARAYCADKGLRVPTEADGVVATATMEWRDDGAGKAIILMKGEATGIPAGRGTSSYVASASFRCSR